MRPGDRIKIRTEDGLKWWARVQDIRTDTDPLDVTMGGLFPGGPPPDTHRKTMAGRCTTTLTVVLEEMR